MNKLFVANWKRYLSVDESITLLSELAEIESEKFDVVIAPNHLAVYPLSHIETPHEIGIQDCFYESEGAYTGVITPEDAAELGCSYAIIGHSERRMYQNESNELIAKKVAAAHAAGLTPILCVGETEDERGAGDAQEIVSEQLSIGLSETDPSGCIVAYEPRWAITGSGSGKAITPEDAQEMHAFIQKTTENACAILYGGSVNPDNISDFVSLDNCDGILVGSASTKLQSLQAMLA